MSLLQIRRTLLVTVLAVFVLLTAAGFLAHFRDQNNFFRPLSRPTDVLPAQSEAQQDEIQEANSPTVPHPLFKNLTLRPLAQRPYTEIEETFPLAATAKSAADLPPIPSWNQPPTEHVPEQTPMFIGFTRNWSLLQQTVVSLITAGWPPGDIYVVENTGVMDANQHHRLGRQNPFFLDYRRLTEVLGVNIMTTPSLQTFAQLQNLYLFEAIQRGWPQYFWSHMDVVIQTREDEEPYKSFYLKCVDVLRQSKAKPHTEDGPGRENRWAVRYFNYDWVTLMNTRAIVEIGGWDTMISYYMTDCDLYERLHMANMSTDDAKAGPIYDVGDSFDDLLVLYRRNSTVPVTCCGESDNGSESVPVNKHQGPLTIDYGREDKRGSETWKQIQKTLEHMGHRKGSGPRSRWQVQQMGGQGDPYHRDADGFQEALEISNQAGIEAFGAKWRISSCDLKAHGLKLEDEWRVQEIVG